jgi:hypothetical protein
MWFDNASVQQFESRRQRIRRRPAEQVSRTDKADKVETTGYHDCGCLGRPGQAGINEQRKQKRADQGISNRQCENDGFQARHSFFK